MSIPTDDLQHTVRLAARALARAGLVHAFGHCSVRLDAATFLVCAARPMGLIADAEDGTVVGVDGALPAGVLGEVRMHQRIYRRRPEVGAICRFMSPHVMALAAMGRMWQDPQLVRNDSSAVGVAETLGNAPAIVVGVNGAVTAAADIARALSLAWFLEDAARVELAVLAAGGGAHETFADAEAARQRATWDGRIAERMWELMTHEPAANDTRRERP
jgi:HCOMODA/2-hydroxy-3-carboxy-muconic semialdehyde decarboxylase